MRNTLIVLATIATSVHCHAQQDKALPTHPQVLEAYKSNPEQAKKYDGQRVKVKAVVFSYGESFTNFGAADEVGNRFDVSFAADQKKAFASKFPDGKLEAFKTTPSPIEFDCLNEGFLPKAIVPSIRLSDCKFSKQP